MKRYIKAAKTIEDYENMGVFDKWQMKEIRKGLEEGLDVSAYADPKFDSDQMDEIRLGLEKGVDVSWYADPKFKALQMFQIRLGLEKGVDVSQYADPKIHYNQMAEIRLSLQDTPKKTKKSSRTNWESLANTLQSEAEDGIDSLYEQTEAGQQVESICQQVESKLGIFVETSIQAGHGSIDFYKDETTASMDYEDFNEAVYNLAVNASSKKNFESSYEEFLEYDLMWDEVESDDEEW